MPSILGKRKIIEETQRLRSSSPASLTSSGSTSSRDQNDAFRRAFEAKFKPLELQKTSYKEANISTAQEVNTQDPESDWEGFDSEEESDQYSLVEVIEHDNLPKPQMSSKAEAKAFMNSKPPSNLSNTLTTNSSGREGRNSVPDDEDGEEVEKLNLKNDIALQRLINESHLLEKVKDDGTSFGQRNKRIDLRFQALGSKTSMLHQDKMPMSHRKGIIAKAKDREERRRREARENGIVLEKATKPMNTSSQAKRLRGVGGPSVGRFKGGTLRLGRRDVAEIRGPARSARKTKTAKLGRW